MKSDNSFILEQAGWPVLVVTADGMVRHANAAAILRFGPKLEGEITSLSALLAEGSEPAEKLLAQFERQAVSATTLKFRGKAGAVCESSVLLSPVRQEEQRRFILQILENRPSGSPPAPDASDGGTRFFTRDGGTGTRPKMDRAAQLTRTVALDLNNALTSVFGHTSLLLSKAEPNHPWRKSLEEVRRAANRAAEIAHQLANYSRPEREAGATASGNLNDLLRRVVERHRCGEGAKRQWEVQLESPLYRTRFDEARLEQALSRLFENAIEATSDRGQIDLVSRNVDITEPRTDGTAALQPGAYVCVELSDRGCGIDPRHLPRVFEPFFTTKPGHRGLGLVLVYGIVTNLGGGVAISSQPHLGTSVRVYLPATRKLLPDAVPSVPARPGGTQTILVVDDEELLLTMSQEILTSFGYRVLTASTGQRALEVLSAASSQVDLVITDLVMPQMSGRELLSHIQRRHPGVRVICTSGYAGSGQGTNEEDFLEKPFTTQDLIARIRGTLDEQAKY